MRSLFSQRQFVAMIIRCNQYVILSIFIIFTCLVGVSNGDDSKLSDKVYNSILNYIGWEKYWFENFYGEKCLNQYLPDDIKFSLTIFPAESELSETGYNKGCNYFTPNEVKINIESVLVRFDNLILSYSAGYPKSINILSNGDSYQDKDKYIVYSVIESDTSLENECIESPDEDTLWDLKYYQELGLVHVESSLKRKDIIEQIENRSKLTRDVSNHLINKKIAISINFYIKALLANQSISLDANAFGKGVIYIGPYNPNDPYVLVFSPDLNDVLKVELPSILFLTDQETCLKVSRLERFVGVNHETTLSKNEYIQITSKIRSKGKKISLKDIETE